MDRSEGSTRTSGFSLLEMAIALTLLTVGVLAMMKVFYSTQLGVHAAESEDLVSIAFDNAIEDMKSAPFEEIFAQFNRTLREVPGLTDPTGGPAYLRVTCFVNEAGIPPECGPIKDLDGNPGTMSADCSTTYRVLPVRLQVAYATAQGSELRDLFVTMDQE